MRRTALSEWFVNAGGVRIEVAAGTCDWCERWHDRRVAFAKASVLELGPDFAERAIMSVPFGDGTGDRGRKFCLSCSLILGMDEPTKTRDALDGRLPGSAYSNFR